MNKKNTAMPEPLRSLFLNACKVTGNMSEASLYIEESLTGNELTRLQKFVAWLKYHNLTVGWGTIDLRWNEWKTGASPMSPDAAYKMTLNSM